MLTITKFLAYLRSRHQTIRYTEKNSIFTDFFCKVKPTFQNISIIQAPDKLFLKTLLRKLRENLKHLWKRLTGQTLLLTFKNK